MSVFEALADGRRRDILELLRERELSVGEIASRFPVTQPAISQHLKVLRDEGLVEQRREGTRQIYSVRPEGFAALHDFLSGFFEDSLLRLKRSAESEARSHARTAERN